VTALPLIITGFDYKPHSPYSIRVPLGGKIGSMKCPSCHRENTSASRFCAGCGARLPGSPEEKPLADTRAIRAKRDGLAAGDVFAGRYRIIGSLGRGGMGFVYKAQDLRLKRIVALKVLPPDLTRDPEALDRFIQEAQSASALDHANICTIYEIGEGDDAVMYIAMAYYAGETLKQRIEHGPLKVPDALDIATQIARGLARAHEAGIVHRDLKPANVIVTERDEVRIIDFGLAKLTGQVGLTRDGTMMGTVTYMSPEQAQGEDVDQRTDIWSLGVVLYEMLTGQTPFKGDRDQTVIYSILNLDPRPLHSVQRHVPAAVEKIVRKAMRKVAADRYQTIEDMMGDLVAVSRALETSDATQISAALVADDDSSRIYVPKPVAVISFENLTGDNEFDYLRKAIPNLLITSLERSRYLHVMTWERMQDLLKQTGKYDIDMIDKDTGFELCRREGVASIVVGSYTKAGDVFATDVKVLDVDSKRLLKSASSRGTGVDSILKTQIDELSKEISLGVGLSERKIEGEGVAPIAEVTTDSMKAYECFLEGREAYEKLYNDDARHAFERAVEIDPSFAVAHLYLAWAYGRLRETSARDRAYEAAKASSARATKKERMYIEASYADSMERDLGKRFRTLKQMAQEFPKEKRVHHLLASYYRVRRLFYQAVEEYDKVLELDPEYGWAMNELAYMYADVEDFEKAYEYLKRYGSLYPGDANPVDSLGELFFRMGKLDKAIGQYKEALRLKPDFYYAYWELAYVYALKEDYDRAMEWIQKFIEHAPSIGTKGAGRQWRSFYLFWQGRLDDALAEVRRLRDMSEDAGSDFWSAEALRLEGWIYLEKGDTERSRHCFEKGVEAIKEHEAAYVPAQTSYSLWTPERIPTLLAGYSFALGLVDIREGKVDAARSRLKEMGGLLPVYAQMLQGEILLAEGLYDEAITLCEKCEPQNVPYMSDTDSMLAYNLPPYRDVLARAFVAMGSLPKACTEYEHLTRFDPRSKARWLIHPAFHHRLAELYRKTGNETGAREQMQKYHRTWKTAR
jgi:serine/threonine protein kinase/Tfp pilus assembly protein PilF